ncbi:MAG TPA: histidine kinase [Pyrinomonadaceae bacterium]|nr:histidine kinase [Pyrinomonadaceae bacterium]HRA39783.1 histidine kinase [Pyrinomonadaceae bacterium]
MEMTALNAALLVNLIGFTVGVALYALIAAMVVMHRPKTSLANVDLLLLTTAVLGLLWNLGELYSFIQKDFAAGGISPWLAAVSFSALGFLPSVVVHSAQADDEGTHWLTYAAYGLSTVAAALHFYSAATANAVPSDLALQAQTVGAVALAIGLLLFNLKQTLEKKTIWASALLVFAVSALHLSGEREGKSWMVELIAHQASLPLALTILYQNYRFAFADLFLKRAISLILLALTAFGLYVAVAAPLLRYHETHDRDDASAISLILTLWIATALIYPLLYRLATWLVDSVILHRADYAELRTGIASEIETIESPEAILTHVCNRIAGVLTAGTSRWTPSLVKESDLAFVDVGFSPNEARIFVPTAESPFFEVRLGEFYGGRRLLSDEIATLEAIALITARRIDALRVTHERYEQHFRQQEFAKLAAEAQLTALRAQVNPHFLFNSLTTIGYLINADPDRAYDTLLRLTQLLRGVLSSNSEFCSLDDEMRLIESYLDIERARFEEKLTVDVDVPDDLRQLEVPALILQPLVENAVKHGISENKKGGTVRISARRLDRNGHLAFKLTVWDSGAGSWKLDSLDADGVGLRNVRERLASYYGSDAKLVFTRNDGAGTTVEIELPLKGRSSKEQEN